MRFFLSFKLSSFLSALSTYEVMGGGATTVSSVEAAQGAWRKRKERCCRLPLPASETLKVVREKHLRTVSLKRVANLYDFGFESLPRSCFPTNQAHQLRGGQEV